MRNEALPTELNAAELPSRHIVIHQFNHAATLQTGALQGGHCEIIGERKRRTK
jgi:hypothetical protein